MKLTQEQLKKALRYSPETGEFSWISPRKCLLSSKGDSAGSLDSRGYVRIQINGVRVWAHRAAWLYVTGFNPENHIDHIDGDKSNNRFENLREATNKQNHQNIRKHQANNKSGLLGVGKAKSRPSWTAQIVTSGNKKYLGSFDSPKKAHEAYLSEKRKLHEFCTI